jgi:hypothetical protein
MRIKFFNLNIKHKNHIFDRSSPEKSAAEYWLNDKKQAPIFFGNDSCEMILSDSGKLKKKSRKTAKMFLTVTANEKIRPIFITIDSGWLWIYEPIGKPQNGDAFRFNNIKTKNSSPEEDCDLPKLYNIKMLLGESPLPISKVPYILGAMKSSQAFAQGTFYPIGWNINDDKISKYQGNLAALVCLLKDVDFVLNEFDNLSIDPLHCLSSIELETLVAKIFEANGCFVPAHRGGVLKDIDLIARASDNTKISGLDFNANETLSIQIKLNISNSKKDINELRQFLDRSKNHYLITSDLDEECHSGLTAYKNSGQFLTAKWIKSQIAKNPSVKKWFEESVKWLPKEKWSS